MTDTLQLSTTLETSAWPYACSKWMLKACQQPNSTSLVENSTAMTLMIKGNSELQDECCLHKSLYNLGSGTSYWHSSALCSHPLPRYGTVWFNVLLDTLWVILGTTLSASVWLKPNQTASNSNTKSYTIVIQKIKHIWTTLTLTKLKPVLGAFYAIRPGNGLGLFYCSQVPHKAPSLTDNLMNVAYWVLN